MEWIIFANKPDDGGSADEVSTGGAIGIDLGRGLVGTLTFLLYSRSMPLKGNEREGSKINNFLLQLYVDDYSCNR